VELEICEVTEILIYFVFPKNVKSKAELQKSIGMLTDAKKMTEKGSKVGVKSKISDLEVY
jgi:hypothetical protein